MSPRCFDVIILGGGPAGLSAALILGRCRRQVMLFDSRQYRNAASAAVHGFLTRDGTDPTELRRIAREQLQPYDSVQLCEVAIVSVRRIENGFEVTSAQGAVFRCRKLLLATGLVDELPRVPGSAELFGRGLYQCPYCDGWEHRDQPLAVYGAGEDKGAGLALEMTIWSRDLVFCSDGPANIDGVCRDRLARFQIEVREERIARFEPSDAGVRICFEGGSCLERRAIFFNTSCRQQSGLATQLGCELDERGAPKVDRYAATNVPGLYVAGDASRDVLQAIVGAGEGCEAAVAINKALLHEDIAGGA